MGCTHLAAGSRWLRILSLCVASACLAGRAASAQTTTQRGFVEARALLFPQTTPTDGEHVVGDILAREEIFVKPVNWVQFAAGIDLRGNTHGQVERAWRFDVRDRDVRRLALSLRRLTGTLTRGPVTVDVGKQFIRWGKADIVTPTDHFAPRDFMNVVDGEFLAVTGARTVVQVGSTSVDVVWVPFFTPSRAPLIGQRWGALPATPVSLTLTDAGAAFPTRSQVGVRWGQTGAGYEYSLSLFDGFNHLPNIDSRPGRSPVELEIVREYPARRSYGVDAAVPTPWFTVKGEVAYSTSTTPGADEYVLYVIQLERQAGEWLVLGGYAGEVMTRRRAELTFAPDRGLTRSLVARASYTIDTNRSLAFETAVRQTGDGLYAKTEYSQARGPHWRATMTAVVIAGHEGDFLGQYRRNSHGTLSLRYSF